MTEDDLDRALGGAEPRVARRTPGLREDLVDLARESARPRRRSLRLVAVGGAAAVVLGSGGLAAAAGVLPGWTSFETGAAGVSCAIDVDVRVADGDGEPGPAFTGAEEQEVLDAARAYLDAYDYAGVDREQAVRELRAEERERGEVTLAELATQERELGLNTLRQRSAGGVELQAVQRHVARDLVAHLDAEGLDHRAVLLSSGERCDER